MFHSLGAHAAPHDGESDSSDDDSRRSFGSSPARPLRNILLESPGNSPPRTARSLGIRPPLGASSSGTPLSSRQRSLVKRRSSRPPTPTHSTSSSREDLLDQLKALETRVALLETELKELRRSDAAAAAVALTEARSQIVSADDTFYGEVTAPSLTMHTGPSSETDTLHTYEEGETLRLHGHFVQNGATETWGNATYRDSHNGRLIRGFVLVHKDETSLVENFCV